jgi:Cache 3/Cache 2 fusion domain
LQAFAPRSRANLQNRILPERAITEESRHIQHISRPTIAAIAKGESYFGEANILGKSYITGYEPIRNASNNVIGIYCVGYLKQSRFRPDSGFRNFQASLADRSVWMTDMGAGRPRRNLAETGMIASGRQCFRIRRGQIA